MNSHDRTRAMVESSLITAIAVILTLAGIYIPLLGYALIFLPVPFIIIGVRHGIKYNVLSVVVASIIIGILTEPLRAIFISVIGGFSAVTMGYSIEKKYGFKKTLFFGVIASIMASIVSFTLMSYFAGINVKEMLEQSFTLGSQINQSIYKSLGSNPDELDEMNKVMENMKNMLIMLLPSSIIFGSAMFAYLNYIVSGSILKRMGKPIEKPERFSYLRLPRNILMGSFIILALTFVLGQWKAVNFETLFANVLYLFFTVYLIQGLAVASYYMERRGLSKGPRIIIIILVLIIPSASYILMFTGLFDVVFNIRKLEK